MKAFGQFEKFESFWFIWKLLNHLKFFKLFVSFWLIKKVLVDLKAFYSFEVFRLLRSFWFNWNISNYVRNLVLKLFETIWLHFTSAFVIFCFNNKSFPPLFPSNLISFCFSLIFSFAVHAKKTQQNSCKSFIRLKRKYLFCVNGIKSITNWIYWLLKKRRKERTQQKK